MELDRISTALPETIATPRLTLRRPVLADAPAIAALANNKKISDMLANLPHPYTSEDAVAFIETRARSGREFAYAIEVTNGPLIGFCGLTARDGKPAEIGYWLGEPFWGKGYAGEAAGALVDAILATGRLATLAARAMATNPASCRLLEKLGFVLTDDRIDDCGQHAGVRVKSYLLEAAAQKAAG